MNNKCIKCPCDWYWCIKNNDCYLDYQDRNNITNIPIAYKPSNYKESSKPKKASKKSLKSKLKPSYIDSELGKIYFCHYCDKKLTYDVLTVDHKKSKFRGGTNKSTNIVPCCNDCNRDKGCLNYEDYIKIKKND